MLIKYNLNEVYMKDIISQFQIIGNLISCEKYGEGHINQTFLVVLDQPKQKFILQKINHYVFKNVDSLMSNYEKITTFMNQHISGEEEFISLIYTHDKKPYLEYQGSFYRLITFIDHAIAYQTVPSMRHMYLAGQAFGRFQRNLSHFDPISLFETIVDFHHTPKRYLQLRQAIDQANEDRLYHAQVWIHHALEQEVYAGKIQHALDHHIIPKRVTHNDTKMNNILFDEKELKVRAIIDLDTIMPGSLLYDFGDAIRFGCNQAKEDEIDLEKVKLNLEYFEAYSRGFIEAVRHHVWHEEINLLVDGAMIMTLEVGIRFLTDYLNHDKYFKIHHERHNLERAMNQITFFFELKKHETQMRHMISSIWGDQSDMA